MNAVASAWNMNPVSPSTWPKTGTFLRLESVAVEDLCGAGPVAAAQLREALRLGVPFTKDRRRKRFYEVQVGSEWYYIHVLKGLEKVLLLARWSERAA